MAETAIEMDQDFPRWYAAVALGNNEERLMARWKAVKALSDKADNALTETLIRLAFGTRQNSGQALIPIHEAISKEDNTFDPRAAERELQVLAGACLQIIIEDGGDAGATAALCATTAAFAGGRTPNLPLDIVGLAEAGLEQIADTHRKRPSILTHANSESPKFDFEAAAAKARESNWENVAAAFGVAANSARAAFKALATRQTNALRDVDRFLKVQDEELQMLWWLTGGRSIDQDCDFGDVVAEAQPLVFAKELADDTVLLPGPRSIKPLLTRAGVKERKKITIAKAINAADLAWLTNLVEDLDPSSVTSPLHFAIKRHVEAGGGETWVPNWGAVVGIDHSRQISALAFGIQFYRERLLATFE
jgi:hypothetical protein